jgi:hypothetical protein
MLIVYGTTLIPHSRHRQDSIKIFNIKRTPGIGFDWVCFFSPGGAVFCRNLLSKKTLRRFALPANWLCFSTLPHEITPLTI